LRTRRPFSLVRRIIALVVGVSVVTLFLHAVLVLSLLSSVGAELAEHIASQVRAASAVLAGATAADRDAIANAISGAGIRVSKLPPAMPPSGSPQFEGVPVALQEKLEQVLQRKVTSFMLFDHEGQAWLNVAVPVADDTWWMTFRANRPSLLWGMLPILPILLIALTAALAMVLGVRLITRPMSRLAQDVLARRHELRQIDEPPDVSVELQSVIRSFNSLVHAVELSSESRRNLLAGVSHDLRTPLTRLRLRVETECSEEVAQKLEADFLALGRIIDQFLAYAQGQSGVAIGEMHPIVDLVEEVASQYRAEGADVSLVRADGGELNVPDLGVQRALVNLVDNARAHGQGPVEIELSWSTTAAPASPSAISAIRSSLSSGWGRRRTAAAIAGSAWRSSRRSRNNWVGAPSGKPSTGTARG
jgi:two-component system, OmpR family, osmolarity sensor histidine kinase EnvZ